MQEVPAPSSPYFQRLRARLAFYASQLGVNIQLTTLLEQWKRTLPSAFGSSVLNNPAVFNVISLTGMDHPMVSAGRAAIYEVSAVEGTKIPVANIHGKGGAANPETERFIQQFNGYCLGDANTYPTGAITSETAGSQAELEILVAGTVHKVKLSTLDVIKVSAQFA